MMNQADIVSFLTSHGIAPLGDWRPGEPILYVVEDPYRTDTSHYGDLPKRLRPSVARLDHPDRIDSSNRAVDSAGIWTRIFRIVNESGGQVDYYAIDPDTLAVTFVKSGATKRDQTCPYVAPETLLFRADDELFPKSWKLGRPLQPLAPTVTASAAERPASAPAPPSPPPRAGEGALPLDRDGQQETPRSS